MFPVPSTFDFCPAKLEVVRSEVLASSADICATPTPARMLAHPLSEIVGNGFPLPFYLPTGFDKQHISD
jgi:hypothetical protein